MRKPPHLVQVSEWQALNLPPHLNGSKIKASLVKAGRTAHGAALRISGQHLRAANLIGIVATTRVQVQILPKAYSDADTFSADSAELLRRMLRLGLPEQSALSNGLVASTGEDLFQGIILHISKRLRSQLLLGVPRRYERRVEELPTIRGRLDFYRQARKPPGNDHKLWVAYAPLHTDNPLTRALRATAETLSGLASSQVARRNFAQCLTVLSEARQVPIGDPSVAKLSTTMLEQEWEWAVNIARLLALDRRSDIVTPGSELGLSALFSLDALFEEIARSSVDRSAAPHGLHVRSARSIGPLLSEAPQGASILSLRPDISVDWPSGKLALVGDAKWKRLSPGGPDRADAFQIYSYLAHSGAQAGFLMYPSRAPLSTATKKRRLTTVHGKAVYLVELDLLRFVSSVDTERKVAEAELGQVVRAMVT